MSTLVIREISRSKPQLASPDCLIFYRLRKIPLAQVIYLAMFFKEVDVLQHALMCEECRMHIQMREQFSSEAEMDIEINEALKCIKETLLSIG